MEAFTLSRKEMSGLLLSLTGSSEQKPLHILQEVWTKFHHEEVRQGMSLPAFLSTEIPPILQKIIKEGTSRVLTLGHCCSWTSHRVFHTECHRYAKLGEARLQGISRLT